MDDQLKQDLTQQFQNLPPEVQKAISSADLPVKLQEITRNNKLLIDQAGNLELETYLVLLGLEPLDDYLHNIVKNVGLPKDKALIVAHDVNESIFRNVRGALKKINEETIAAENEKIAPNEPKKEEIISGIEGPEKIKANEASISFSSLASNKPQEERPADLSYQGVEVRREVLPQIESGAILPIITPEIRTRIPLHENVSPVQNIVEEKMSGIVVVPKENVIIEEKTKLPEKKEGPTHADPYRETLS